MENIDAYFAGLLRNELADATVLVWKLQQALCDPPSSNIWEEVTTYARELANRSQQIEAHVARRNLMAVQV